MFFIYVYKEEVRISFMGWREMGFMEGSGLEEWG